MEKEPRVELALLDVEEKQLNDLWDLWIDRRDKAQDQLRTITEQKMEIQKRRIEILREAK
jgi:hypothetical protein